MCKMTELRRVADPKDGEFRIGIEYDSRKSVITMLYAKCKNCGRGCDWFIRASLIQKKACWEIRRYNGSHTCSMGTISQDHSKLDSDIVAEAMKPLVREMPSGPSVCQPAQAVVGERAQVTTYAPMPKQTTNQVGHPSSYNHTMMHDTVIYKGTQDKLIPNCNCRSDQNSGVVVDTSRGHTPSTYPRRGWYPADRRCDT
ncbi:hypothetical protein Ahy_B01g056728 [Arachis hypogaea]|uniref:Transposase MuDR plant domain-containing protein n=1 Tax=Arachis hypogaea TaxID=3818 RepID=A0A445AZG4_ARAHY|nr:hypothetical protein Ahy_B01g056728 [Arachis hypogaea]